jgi:hypothetical protein
MNIKYCFLILIFTLVVLFLNACTQSDDKLSDYIGIDLPSKKWNKEYGKPLIYLKDVFFPIKGGSYPKFVLYENGQLIYGKIENERQVYYEVLLSKMEMKNIFNKLGIPKYYFFEENHFNIEHGGEPPETVFIINNNYKKIITMYGSISYMSEQQKKEHKKLVTIYNNIINFIDNNNLNAKEWIPDHIEMIIFDFLDQDEWMGLEEYEWPSNFPDLSSSDTIEIIHRNNIFYDVIDYIDYILIIHKELYDDFFDYMYIILGDRDGWTGLIINDKKLWLGLSASNFYYIPLPNIKEWDYIFLDKSKIK